jgi:hypothetical protein
MLIDLQGISYTFLILNLFFSKLRKSRFYPFASDPLIICSESVIVHFSYAYIGYTAVAQSGKVTAPMLLPVGDGNPSAIT